MKPETPHFPSFTGSSLHSWLALAALARELLAYISPADSKPWDQERKRLPEFAPVAKWDVWLLILPPA